MSKHHPTRRLVVFGLINSCFMLLSACGGKQTQMLPGEAADNDVIEAINKWLKVLRNEFSAYYFDAKFSVENIEKL